MITNLVSITDENSGPSLTNLDEIIARADSPVAAVGGGKAEDICVVKLRKRNKKIKREEGMKKGGRDSRLGESHNRFLYFLGKCSLAKAAQEREKKALLQSTALLFICLPCIGTTFIRLAI